MTKRIQWEKANRRGSLRTAPNFLTLDNIELKIALIKCLNYRKYEKDIRNKDLTA